MDPFSLFLITLISVLSGGLYYQLNTDQKEPVESDEAEPLGDYEKTPAYSQGILDFYRKLIQEWVVIKFRAWRNTHNMEFSNRDHFRKLVGEILLDFFETFSLRDNVKFEYCLFTEEYLINYISMVAMETMTKLVENEILNSQEGT